MCDPSTADIFPCAKLSSSAAVWMQKNSNRYFKRLDNGSQYSEKYREANQKAALVLNSPICWNMVVSVATMNEFVNPIV